MKIGLFGFGTVGQGLYRVLQMLENVPAEIVKICVRDVEKPRAVEVEPGLLTDNAADIIDNPDVDLIVEVIDDAESSFSIVKEALKRGKPVVSGNKAMIARHLPEILALQEEYDCPVLYDASSCGSLPVIRNLEEYYDNDLLLEVKGILNGSSNYILSRVFDHGEDYDSALRKAQEKGFAESDPTFDVEGFDALYKLVIITVHAFGVYVNPDDVFTYGISHLSADDIRYAREKGVKIKLVAQVVKLPEGKFTMFVMPELVEPSRYIYSVDDEYNGVVIRGQCYDRQFMFGKGAGSLPTASSILSDIMARAHKYRYEYKKMKASSRPEYTTDVLLRVYIRYGATPILQRLSVERIREQFVSDDFCYAIVDVKLSELMARSAQLHAPDVFIANIPLFFKELDN